MELKNDQQITSEEVTKKPYAKPTIIHELDLEVRAGSPNFLINPFDFTGLEN